MLEKGQPPIVAALSVRVAKSRGRDLSVVRRPKRSQQREVLQPLTGCRDSRLRCSGQRDRDARAQRRFSPVLSRLIVESGAHLLGDRPKRCQAHSLRTPRVGACGFR